MSRKDLPDQELWLAVKGGDANAFVILYNRYWSQLYRTAKIYIKDPSQVEELIHDVFVVLWNRREHLNIEKFQPYITVSLRYHIFKWLKSSKGSLLDYVEEYLEEPPCSSEEILSEKIRQEDFEIELNSHLQGLPKRCIEIFLLSRVKNLSNFEIAGQLGISRFTVENQITYALKHLRERFRK